MFHPDTTILASLAGGILIGFSAVLLMGLVGRIAGIAGLASGLIPPWRDSGQGERVAFIAGIIVAPTLWWLATGLPSGQEAQVGPLLLVVGGLITGFGAVWGFGCTSGHGVCGLSRLSPRSAVAVSVFMATAFVTVFLARHVIG